MAYRMRFKARPARPRRRKVGGYRKRSYKARRSLKGRRGGVSAPRIGYRW